MQQHEFAMLSFACFSSAISEKCIHTFGVHAYLTPNHPGNDPHPQLQFKSTSPEVLLSHTSFANARSFDSYSVINSVLGVKFCPPEGAESIHNEYSARFELSVFLSLLPLLINQFLFRRVTFNLFYFACLLLL